MAIVKGDKVSIEYEGTLDNGDVFDSTKHDGHSHPLEFEAGSPDIIKGFSGAVIGMNLNEEKEFVIEPADAYGERDETLIREVPKDALPQEPAPQAGMTLVMKTPDGHQMLATIAEVGAESVKIDLNHPLAGKRLHFKIKVVGINNDSQINNK